MGLFSRKAKQDRLAQDSGRFYSKDDDAALGERARSKRASNTAGAAPRRSGNDPMLPEKKRARRRLVGAIALALAAAVGLPMLLDSAPKPLAGDIAIQIPAKDKAAPLPVPAADKSVAAEDSVDKGEEVVTAPPAASSTKTPAAARPDTAAPLPPPEPKPERRPEPAARAEPPAIVDRRLDADKAAEHKAAEHKDLSKPEHKDARADTRLAEHDKAEQYKADKPVKPKPDDKPAKPREPDDAARALAILEGKPAKADKPVEHPAESGAQKFVLQVAAVSSAEKAAELQAKLREAGISSYTEKSAAGGLTRVRIGPLSRDDAEKVRAKLGRIGMSGAMTPI